MNVHKYNKHKKSNQSPCPFYSATEVICTMEQHRNKQAEISFPFVIKASAFNFNATFVNFFSIAVKEAPVSYLYVAVDMFIGVALVEEGFKWLTLVFFTKKSKEFNCLFDGMIYAIFVSLGFAALENILYVLNNGWVNAATRAILSVPGHMFFAVMMGYYYSRWNIFAKAREGEEWLAANGYIRIRNGASSPMENRA